MTSGIKLGNKCAFEFNPRGNLWYNDESTFGHKLLNRMGWSKGKGLGKNENGIKENIKLSKKEDVTGVGYKHNVHISVGCDEYENILNKLNQHFNKKETTKFKDSDASQDLKSLEQRSQTSRSRLHYQKFVRGKDLFKRSEKDLKCIFLENPKDLEDSTSENIEKKESTAYTSPLNVNDYFAMKMQKKFGFGSKATCKEDSIKNEPDEPVSNNRKSTKKRKSASDGFEKGEPKKMKLECDELLDQSSNSSNNAKNYNNENPDFSKLEPSISSTKLKTKKNKLHKIKKLKSCFKNSESYSLNEDRKVSFNEEVSFKILDTSFEDVTPINDSIVEELHKNESECSSCDDNEQKQEILTRADEINTSEENKNMNEEEEEDDDDDLTPECLNIPKCSANNFNFWLESQRAAIKMKAYKRMIKKIKKDKMLRTTNLLNIKGYGNWGI